jgi:hypothetical protein
MTTLFQRTSKCFMFSTSSLRNIRLLNDCLVLVFSTSSLYNGGLLSHCLVLRQRYSRRTYSLSARCLFILKVDVLYFFSLVLFQCTGTISNAKGMELGSTGTGLTFPLLPPSWPSRGSSIVDPHRWMHRFKGHPHAANTVFIKWDNPVILRL